VYSRFNVKKLGESAVCKYLESELYSLWVHLVQRAVDPHRGAETGRALVLLQPQQDAGQHGRDQVGRAERHDGTNLKERKSSSSKPNRVNCRITICFTPILQRRSQIC